ncbi:transcriptional regulator, IclR family [Halobacillus dabanensis]|uniref:Glycerol operon regulatory protein n=1 Tax=Halobacillus dabanensis TaxID=240302 RepID=A0A1I3RGN9_HALDA|nr:IclR family transcriptional regulator [Halobacillus dabanensis]SFJ44437.1 transcriptional regulator, IclR family [Halobacillus dabanensis]
MSNVQSVDRSLSILEILANEQRGLSITELSYRLSLAKSTVHRLISTLVQRGYIVQNSETDKYSLGMKVVALSNFVLENLDIRNVVRKHIEALGNKTDEVVHLCIQERDHVIYIDKVESNHTIRMYSRIGKQALMHCTGVGKVLMSEMDKKEIDSIIERQGLPSYTESTITDRDTLLENLKQIRKQGFALDELEHEEGMRCVAAPVRDHTGKVIASISIAGPTSRITKERVEKELIPQLLNAAQLCSRDMGNIQF